MDQKRRILYIALAGAGVLAVIVFLDLANKKGGGASASSTDAGQLPSFSSSTTENLSNTYNGVDPNAVSNPAQPAPITPQPPIMPASPMPSGTGGIAQPLPNAAIPSASGVALSNGWTIYNGGIADHLESPRLPYSIYDGGIAQRA